MWYRLRERGAAAVEFALIAPILILLLMGLVSLSGAYMAKSNLDAAARDGARTMAITNDASKADVAVRAIAPWMTGTVSTTACTGAATSTTVTVTHTFTMFTFSIPMTGKGVMRCGG